MREVGYPGVLGRQWNGIIAPAGTPRDIVEKLNTKTAKVLASSETQEKFSRIGAAVVGGAPESFAAFLRNESDPGEENQYGGYQSQIAFPEPLR